MTTPSIDVYQLEKLRPLGALEQFSSARHDLGFFHNVGISASYSTHSKNELNLKELIYSALSIVIQRHPILSAIPVDENTPNPYFARLPTINLESVVTFLTRKSPIIQGARDVELDEILEVQHNTPFKKNYGTVPFWRIIILMNPSASNEFIASFIYHHALGDGASGIAFHNHFRTALSSHPSTLPQHTIPTPTNPLLPNLELLHPLPISKPTTSIPLFPHRKLWTSTPVTLPSTTNFQSLTIPSRTATALLQTCRANSTTLTAVLPVIIANALFSLLPPEFTDLECMIPVNIRHWLPDVIDKDSIGTWIDAFPVSYVREDLNEGLEGETGWEEARRTKGVIGTYLATGGEAINVARFKRIKDMREFFKGRIGGVRGGSFDVSNLGVGVAAGKEDEEWAVGRMVFSRSAFVSGGAFSVGVVTGGDGCLVLGFVWQEGVVERMFVETVVGMVENQIKLFVRQQ